MSNSGPAKESLVLTRSIFSQPVEISIIFMDLYKEIQKQVKRHAASLLSYQLQFEVIALAV